MRGVVSAFGALVFAATMPLPVAAQCYGPECDRYRSGPPNYYGERSAQPSSSFNQPNSFHQPNSFSNEPYRSAPYDQGRPHAAPAPYPQPNHQRHSRPNYQPHPQPNYQQHPQPPVQQYSQPGYQPPGYQAPGYQAPGYQAPPRPPAGYSNVPPRMMPPAQDYRQGPGGQVHVRTKVTRHPKGAKYTVRQHQPAPDRHSAVRGAPPPAGGGQITISMAEYRDLQNQARELQRLLNTRSGPPNKRSPFPDVPPPPGKPARL